MITHYALVADVEAQLYPCNGCGKLSSKYVQVDYIDHESRYLCDHCALAALSASLTLRRIITVESAEI